MLVKVLRKEILTPPERVLYQGLTKYILQNMRNGELVVDGIKNHTFNFRDGDFEATTTPMPEELHHHTADVSEFMSEFQTPTKKPKANLPWWSASRYPVKYPMPVPMLPMRNAPPCRAGKSSQSGVKSKVMKRKRKGRKGSNIKKKRKRSNTISSTLAE